MRNRCAGDDGSEIWVLSAAARIDSVVRDLFFRSTAWNKMSRIFFHVSNLNFTYVYVHKYPEFKSLRQKCYLQKLQSCVILKDSQGKVVQLHFRQVPNDIVHIHKCCSNTVPEPLLTLIGCNTIYFHKEKILKQSALTTYFLFLHLSMPATVISNIRASYAFFGLN